MDNLRIWKYTLPVADCIAVVMPEGARPLSVQMQGEQPQLWALVNPMARPVERRFYIYGTGHPLPEFVTEQAYVGTFQMHGGGLVFHLFETVPQTRG